MKHKGVRLIPLLLLVCLAATVAEVTFYGGNVFMLESLEVPTTVTIGTGSGSSDQNFTVTVYGNNGADETWARWDGQTLLLTQHDPKSSSGLTLSPNKSIYFFALLLAPLLLLGFDVKKLIFFAALLGLLYVNVQAQGGSYSVVVTIPTGMTMETIAIINQNGDVTGTGFSTRNFIAMIGQNNTGGSGRLTLNSASIMKVGNIATADDVQISSLTPSSNALQLTIAPGKPESSNIQINSYFGVFSVVQGSNFATTFSGPHCSWSSNGIPTNGDNSSTTSMGTCTPPSRSMLVVDTTQSTAAAGSLNIDFGPATCTASWVDPVLDYSDLVTPTPTISSEIAGQSYTFNAKNLWTFNEYWTNAQGNVTTGSTTSEMSIDSFALGNNAWHPNAFWLLCDECLPLLRQGMDYNLSFSFKLGAGNTQVVTSIVPALFINPNYRRYWRLDPTSLTNETERFLAVGPELISSAKPVSSSSYTAFSAILRPSADLYSGVWRWNAEHYWENPPSENINAKYIALGIRVVLSQDVGRVASNYLVKDLTFTQPSFTYSVPQNLVGAQSQYFTPRKPSLELDPNPRGSECAWTQSGVKQWHDPATWGGSVPLPGRAVTIPTNTKVVVGACINGNTFYPNTSITQFYPKITIPAGSALIFTDAVINIHVQDILVQGNLTIGTQNCRVFSPMSITFHGSNTGQDTIGTSMGSKGIGVDGGVLDIHAKQYHFTWTRLAASAMPGDDRVYLQDSVNWEVGQEVLIVTTFYQDDWWDQNELRTIKAIDYIGNVVQFTEPLNFPHYAGEEYQAEIGLISRRVLLQGNPGDSVAAGFGGHVIIRGDSTGRFSGVQATAMGQTNLLARYPYHFHLLYENGSRSFIHDSSCKNTLYRCVTVHGTYNVDIQRNVGFHSIGHAFYMEDGVEENNTFAYNLAVHTQIIGTPAAGEFQGGITVNQGAGLTQPADISAAGFYITNAMNTYIGNAASGGWTGFAFPNLFFPINEHQDWKMDPSARPLKLFDGNTAHSAGYYWGSGCCMYVGGNLRNNGPGGPLIYLSGRIARNTRWPILPTDIPSTTAWQGLGWSSTSPQAFMTFNNSKAFLCQKGINHWGNTVELTNYESHDNTLSATVFGQAWVGGAIINGKSGNPLSGTPNHRGFQFYDTYVQSILTDVTFKNFAHDPSLGASALGATSESDNTVLISMTHSDKYKPQGISTTNRIRFENVERSQTIGHLITDTGSSRYYNFIDTDGSFTSSSGAQIVGAGNSGWWIVNDNCRYEWDVYMCAKQPGQEIANIIILSPGLVDPNPNEPPFYTSNHIGTMSLWGDNLNSKYPNRTTIFTTMPGVTGVSNIGWYWYVNKNNDTISGLAPLSFSINTELIPSGTWIMFATSYPAGTEFNVTTDYMWGNTGDAVLQKASSLDQVKNGRGNDYYYFDGTWLYMKLVNQVPASPETFERGGAKLYVTNGSFNYYVKATNCQATNGFCFARYGIPTANLR